MALGNYAAAVWDGEGKPVPGIAKMGEYEIEVYKSWINVYRGGEKVLEFHGGKVELEMGTLFICGRRKRAPEALFFYIADYESKKVLTGIAAYGYRGEEWVGITEDLRQEFLDWLERAEEAECYPNPVPYIEFDEMIDYNQAELEKFKWAHGRPPTPEEFRELFRR